MEKDNNSETVHFPLLLPELGLLHQKDDHRMILCKPKLMSLKTVTLEKLEQMQKEAEDKLKEQNKA